MQATEIKVLLIDDDEDDFIAIRDLLREIKTQKYNITWKASYKEGVQALKDRKFDVCLLDFRLGEFSGLQLLEDSKDTTDMCPIILLTGFGDMELDLKAMKMGAADYLVKEKLTGLLLERSLRYSFKRAQDVKELREQKENFKTLFNSTFEGIIVYKDNIIQDVNESAGNLFGRTLRDMINHPLNDFIRSDRQPEFQKNLVNEGTVFESVGIRSDGSEISILVSTREVSLQGQKTTLIAISDLSQRKQMEAQILRQDRLASLGLLASSLAHEIGTPLGVIRGRAQFISDKSKEEKLKNDMGLIISQIDRVAKLVNSLLHLAREKKSDVGVPVNVKSVIEDVTRLIQHELERNSVKLEIFCGDNHLVQAEAGPLGQVLLNLLVNSFHAIEDVKKKNQSGKEHKVVISAFDESDNTVIAVQDTGSGIEEKNLKHIFKPFFTTKEIGLGTGLGLATSYKLVQSWNGTMDVTSKIGQGTTFKISLKKTK